MITFQQNDGGRAAAGYTGTTGDCVTRAVAIASRLPYKEVYKAMAHGNATQRITKHTRSKNANKRTARNGIYTTRKWFKDYMKSIGFEWVATMGIGTGCTVHLRADELPTGRLVVAVSKHYTSVIDGVLNDTYNCSRGGDRCVYGYWKYTREATLSGCCGATVWQPAATEKLKGVGSNTLLTHRTRMMNKHGVTGQQIDAELHRRVAEEAAKK